MEGPRVDSAVLDYNLLLTYRQKSWLTPTDYNPKAEAVSTHTSKRTDTSMKLRYSQRKVSVAYFAPLPYDTYGSRETVRFRFCMNDLYRISNETPWVTPYWRYQFTRRILDGDVVNVLIPSIPTLPDRDPEGALIASARAKANATVMNLAVFIKEANQTMGMFARRIKQLDRAIRLIRKGQFNKAAKSLGIRTPRNVDRTKHWSNNFLEYQYGWIPLLADVSGSAQFLAEFLLTTPVLSTKARVEIEKAPVVTTGTYSAFPPHAGNASNYQHYLTIRRTDTVVERHDVTLNFRMQSQLMRELSKLGLLNQEVYLLETVPLSFVVEWFANVNDVLSSFTAPNGLAFLGGSYSRISRIKRVATIIGAAKPYVSGATIVESSFSSTDGEYEGWNMRREIYTELPPPELVFSLPGTQQWKKSIVAAALLRQRINIP